MPFGGGMRLGGGTLIVIVIVSLLFGINPLQFLGMMESGGPVVAPPQQPAGARRAARAGRRAESAEGFRQPDGRRHRGRLDGTVQGHGHPLRAPDAGSVLAFHRVGMRNRQRRVGPFLLSRAIRRSIWTRRSSANCRVASARPAISPRLM